MLIIRVFDRMRNSNTTRVDDVEPGSDSSNVHSEQIQMILHASVAWKAVCCVFSLQQSMSETCETVHELLFVVSHVSIIVRVA